MCNSSNADQKAAARCWCIARGAHYLHISLSSDVTSAERCCTWMTVRNAPRLTIVKSTSLFFANTARWCKWNLMLYSVLCTLKKNVFAIARPYSLSQTRIYRTPFEWKMAVQWCERPCIFIFEFILLTGWLFIFQANYQLESKFKRMVRFQNLFLKCGRNSFLSDVCVIPCIFKLDSYLFSSQLTNSKKLETHGHVATRLYTCQVAGFQKR